MPKKKLTDQSPLQFKVCTRVNEKRFNALQDLLAKSRFNKISQLVREILENRPIKIIVHDDSVDQYLKIFSSIKKELNSIGVNINQLTKAFHTGSSETQKAITALRIAEQYKEVDKKIQVLLTLISDLSRKWLQK